LFDSSDISVVDVAMARTSQSKLNVVEDIVAGLIKEDDQASSIPEIVPLIQWFVMV